MITPSPTFGHSSIGVGLGFLFRVFSDPNAFVDLAGTLGGVAGYGFIGALAVGLLANLWNLIVKFTGR